eukprot:TRINITY_DN15449_c0_g2_i1.p1 TRINITY_DN15449_c0_g2~~TRINITY_DN15449_c0_g2_i1.p1  ORF type:complete len:332 (-),score=74.72 TRINITY_DN15449_c0_g2_i1:244-1239(-)
MFSFRSFACTLQLLLEATNAANAGLNGGLMRSEVDMRREDDAVPKHVRILYGINVAEEAEPTGSLLEEDGPMLYGIYSSNVTSYKSMLDAQFATWAKDVPRRDVVVSGSRRDDALEGVDRQRLRCGDEPSQQPCKEGTLLYRAHVRAKERNTDWFVSATEDKYIWTADIEKALARFDPKKPVVFSNMGCGYNLKSPEHIGCKQVYDKGGMCGGTTYIMSRGALDAIVKEGQSYDDFMKEYLENVGEAHASDIVTSCLLYKRNIPMIFQDGITERTDTIGGKVQGNSKKTLIKSIRKQLRKDAFVVHIVAGGEKPMVSKIMRALDYERLHRK